MEFLVASMISERVSLAKANVDVPAETTMCQNAKWRMYSNVIMNITNKYALQCRCHKCVKWRKSSAKNAESTKCQCQRPDGSRSATQFMTKNVKLNTTSIAKRRPGAISYIRPSVTTVDISSIARVNPDSIVTPKPSAIEPPKQNVSLFKRINVQKSPWITRRMLKRNSVCHLNLTLHTWLLSMAIHVPPLAATMGDI